jgi:hypothetical protein
MEPWEALVQYSRKMGYYIVQTHHGLQAALPFWRLPVISRQCCARRSKVSVDISNARAAVLATTAVPLTLRDHPTGVGS